MKISIDIDKLNDAIERAFQLGKIYATDELATCREGVFKNARIPQYNDMSDDEWNAALESLGGYALHSGDAKREIMMEVLVSGELGDALQFD